MKTVSQALMTHMGQPETTMATLWKIVRTDGIKFGFTDHDLDITFNDGTDTITYTPSEGGTGSATDTSSMDTSSQDIVGFLDDEAITEVDLFAGLYDYTVIEVRLVNWADLTMGALLWKRATLGEVQIKNGQFTAELRGLEFWLTINMGEVYQPLCRADFGDTQCTVDKALWTQDGAVGYVADRRTFIPSSSPTGLLMTGSSTPSDPAPTGWFNQGVIQFTGGSNSGFSMEVVSWDGTVITLFESMPYDIQSGDTFTIVVGCDKLVTTCNTKFDNVDNHRGEPFIPGMDQILIYPNVSGVVPS